MNKLYYDMNNDLLWLWIAKTQVMCFQGREKNTSLKCVYSVHIIIMNIKCGNLWEYGWTKNCPSMYN